MARQKRNSQVLKKAKDRLCNVQSAGVEFEGAMGLSLEKFSKTIETLNSKMDNYNAVLYQADKLRLEVESAEKAVADYASKVLTGVAVIYGKDSYKYKAAGGTVKDRRKPRTRKAKATANKG